MKRIIFNNINNYNKLIVESNWSRDNFIFPTH